jgi:anaerobic magnesium-protoporphyrin IX monomethyl ester cyclase
MSQIDSASILLTTLNAKYIHLNLAIRLLFDLNKDHCNLSWKEFTIKNPTDEIADFCSQYDVVCFSCYIWNITETLAACEAIKQLNPNVYILLGGPEVSYEWEDVIQLKCVDAIITGEGEIPFTEFVKSFPTVTTVPNLIYKNDDESVHFNKQQVQFNLIDLKDRNPYQYDTDEALRNKVCYIEMSRGCPYKCEFCLASLDNKMRYIDLETIKHNLLYLMDRGRVIKFLDRTFNVKKDFTIALFQFIVDHHKPGNVFQFEITADIVHPEIIKFIQEKVPEGLFRFEIGIQTVNQQSNLEVSRKQNFEKTSGVIKQLDQKVEMHLDLIVGLPLEYWDNLKFSFESTFKLFPPELQLGFLKFLKGTPVREKYEQYGYQFDPKPPYQIIKSNFLSEQELHAIIQLEDALEIYWNKKRSNRTLIYVANHYSIFDFLLGLGKYFNENYLAHKHTLKEVYQCIFDFAKSHYNDPILLQLLGIDYYAFHKVKPQDLFQIELDKIVRNRIVQQSGLNHFNQRFAMFPIDFDLSVFETEKTIVSKKDALAVIAFDGKQSTVLNDIPIKHVLLHSI